MRILEDAQLHGLFDPPPLLIVDFNGVHSDDVDFDDVHDAYAPQGFHGLATKS